MFSTRDEENYECGYDTRYVVGYANAKVHRVAEIGADATYWDRVEAEVSCRSKGHNLKGLRETKE